MHRFSSELFNLKTELQLLKTFSVTLFPSGKFTALPDNHEGSSIYSFALCNLSTRKCDYVT